MYAFSQLYRSPNKLSRAEADLYCFLLQSKLPTPDQISEMLRTNTQFRLLRPVSVWTTEGAVHIPNGMMKREYLVSPKLTALDEAFVVTMGDL